MFKSSSHRIEQERNSENIGRFWLVFFLIQACQGVLYLRVWLNNISLVHVNSCMKIVVCYYVYYVLLHLSFKDAQ